MRFWRRNKQRRAVGFTSGSQFRCECFLIMGDVLKGQEGPGTGFPVEEEDECGDCCAEENLQEDVSIFQGKPGEPEGREGKEDDNGQKRRAGIAEVHYEEIGKAENSVEDSYNPFLRDYHIDAETEHGCGDHPGSIWMETQHELNVFCYSGLLP